MTPFDNLLAIDCSTKMLKLAVSFGPDRLVRSDELMDRSHGQVLTKKIGDLLGSAGLRISDLHGIIVSIGPGSFTGLRIGLAGAKGMAVALNLPVVGISLFEIAAYRLAESDEPVRVLIPLKKDELFVGIVHQGLCDLSAVSVQSHAALLAEPNRFPSTAVGYDLSSVLPTLRALANQPELVFDAADFIHLGRERLEQGQSADLAALEPLYLQKSQAEIRFDQRHPTP